MIPAEVTFAALMYAGDWTEGIVPEVDPCGPGLWAFDYEGQWTVEDRKQGVYEVRYDGELVCDIYAYEEVLDSGKREPRPGIFVMVSAETGEAVKCRLDADGMITELGSIE